MVRAKFTLQTIETHEYRPGSSSKYLVFNATYDQTIPEDQRFSKATPSGTLRMQVDNPAAVERFEPGKAYYLDFTPVPVPVEPAK